MSDNIKTEADSNTDRCVLCGAEFTSFFDRNNPWPLSYTGECCGVCNDKVIIERLYRFAIGGEDE